LPFFLTLNFLSRKAKDFELWTIGLVVHKLGYYTLLEGRNLLILLAGCINKNRYSTSSNSPDTLPTQELVNALFAKPAPFDLNSGLSHTQLAQEASRKSGGRHGFLVYVYFNDVLVDGAPFTSYNAAQKALCFKGNRTIARYIDTGKVFGSGYTFYSSPKS
jgi:hypothetical protein